MSKKNTVASKKFLTLLGFLQGNSIQRKDLITLAANHLKISYTQAEGLVARNIYKLQKCGLISSSGKRGERTYHFLPPLLELVSQNKQINSKLSDQARLRQALSTNETELQTVEGELQTYNDLKSTYPSSRKEIMALIKERTEHANRLQGGGLTL